MKKTLTFHVDSREHHQLLNALTVAAERFAENATTFKKVEATGGNGFISPEGAAGVASDFERQAATTRMLHSFFMDMVEPFTVHAESEDEEDENPFHPESPEGRAWEAGKRHF